MGMRAAAVDVAVGVQAVVRVEVDVEEAAPPADEEPDGEAGNQDSDRSLGTLLDAVSGEIDRWKALLEEPDSDKVRNFVRTVKTILQNKRVLYVSQTRVKQPAAATASATPAPGGTQTQQTPAAIENVIIVFAGTDQDAEVIKFAQNEVSEVGALTAVLRNTQDSATERTTGITIDRLVTQYGLAIPNIIKQLSPK